MKAYQRNSDFWSGEKYNFHEVMLEDTIHATEEFLRSIFPPRAANEIRAVHEGGIRSRTPLTPLSHASHASHARLSTSCRSSTRCTARSVRVTGSISAAREQNL